MKSLQLGLQPAPAWMAILGLVLFSALCILVGAGSVLNLAFPVGALSVGVFLYFRYPILYVGFTWWMWFLAPLVRRLSDYRGGGYTEPSPIMLAPHLVVLVTLVTFWQYLPKTHRQGGLPFILSFAGVFYGFFVALIYRSPFTFGKAFLIWLIPVIFGFHLFVNWRNYPSYRQNIERTFLWGVLVMGVYGIVQYLVAPAWDRFWLINAGMASQGIPQPLGIRVWSTMDSTEPFSAVITAGLLLLFTHKGTLSFLASATGYLSFLLALARTAWGGWFVGLLTLATSLKANLQMRLIITILVMVAFVVPLTTIEPFSEPITSRLETLSSIEESNSTQARQETYSKVLGSALTSFLGKGIGGQSYDSAVLAMLFRLGWLGTILYMGGILLLVFSLFRGSESRFDLFAATARAIVVSALVRLPFNAPMVDSSGVILWGFLGIGMAAHKYHQHQRTAGFKQSLPQNPPDI
ncbi:MAG: glucose-6-phosphate isomerase [Cyanobacteria bacterium QH_6_48_35]|nr:MAG: glucose-6-phosphate isomerase [Cyanobacteria bacterium QH_1_48_107]PSO67020.1 MAG: glucose-6-phosphate isomerase [Cyanobacteria bacterium QH_6_48_35]